jgi:hypothetical protein
MVRRLVIGWVLGVLVSAPAAAAITDPLIEGAKLCTRHLPRFEREYGIPTHLLSAIASTESGRYHRQLKIAIPWPWTINAEGKGYYFDSKAEAIAAARKLRAQGVRSMDVGCMQVNLFHHANAFASLEQAFEPERNIAYAASFLRQLYEEEKSWKVAASHYHSKTPSRGTQYVGNVYDHWYTIVSRLREAKGLAPAARETALADNSVPAMQPPKPAKPAAAPVQVAQPKAPAPRVLKVASALPEQRGSKNLAAHQPPRMNSIKITRMEDKRENGIIVVRPKVSVVDVPSLAPAAGGNKPAPSIVVADAGSHAAPVARTVRVEGASSRSASGPRFIFDN